MSWWEQVSSGRSSSQVYTETGPHVPLLDPDPNRRPEACLQPDGPAGEEITPTITWFIEGYFPWMVTEERLPERQIRRLHLLVK